MRRSEFIFNRFALFFTFVVDCGIFAREGHSAERLKKSLKFTCCSWVRETAGGAGIDEAEKEEQD